MIVRCSKCSTEFDLNPQQVGPEGVTLRCSVCEHMFHAEPNPDAGVHQPWQLCNSENHLFTLPDLATVIQWIEDGQLRPDDQISRTGSHWLRLGEFPELSAVFVGFDGLPRVFRALDDPPAVPASGDLGPPPSFGEGLGDIPAFGVGNSPADSQSMPASMLDAVTKAVSAPPAPPEKAGDGVVQRRQAARSQPILVADLAAKDSVVDGQVEPSAETSVSEPSAPRESSAPSSSKVAAVPEGTPSSGTAVVAGVGSGVGSVGSVGSGAGGESSSSAEASALTSTPAAAAAATEARLGERPEPAAEDKGGGLGWLALLGVAAGLAVMFGVPEIRAKIFGGGDSVAQQPAQVTAGESPVEQAPADLSVADRAIHSLGLDETTRAHGTLQKMIDARESREESVDDIKLAQVELLLTRAVALRAAVSLDPTAVNGTARSRADEDARWAADLLATIDAEKVTDKERWGRTEGLHALVEGRLGEAATLVPPTATELAQVVKAAPLWQIADGPVPSGLIGGLQGLKDPSTLSRSLYALALWRSGDEEGAQKIVIGINQTVPDQPLAITLDRALAAAIAAEGTEEAPVEVVAPKAGTPKVRRPRTPSGGDDPTSGDPASLTPRGCEKVRGGDPTAGVKLLLAAIDANAMNLETYLCLGEGYMKMGNTGSSLSFYSRAVKIAPKNKAALTGAAGAAAKLKRDAQALDFYKRLLAVDPSNEAAKSYLASKGLKAGDSGAKEPDAGAGSGGGSGGVDSAGAGAGAGAGADSAGAGSGSGAGLGDAKASAGDEPDGDSAGDSGGSPFLPLGGGG